MMFRVISGGQTGVDQAALDAAIACRKRYGGWLPAGRKTESGPLSEKYIMDEMMTDSYPARTRKNVITADATLIISRGRLSGGSALTSRIAVEEGRPCLHVDLKKLDHTEALLSIKRWLRECAPHVLNIAGPRASSDEGIYDEAYALVYAFLNELDDGARTPL
ncbi:MAG: putative molybdenum carrier protein [Desulfopila sp.]|jgi:predicted Rossmann fold nucleotide-binding protein DprA/Smf involved in DNA uptake|nr:putative molybdenum carrier protein [Desulfopila sp.]